MQKRSLLLPILLLLFFNNCMGQRKKNNYNYLIFKVVGDLNNDKLDDIVTVKADTTNPYYPYILEIKFQNKEGHYISKLISEKAVMPLFPNGDVITEIKLENLVIHKGILIFTNQLLRGSYVHKFRFQNNKFELIGFTQHNASAGYIDFVDYNLSTGKKISQHIDYQNDSILEQTESIEKIKPLPNLKDFTPFDFVY